MVALSSVNEPLYICDSVYLQHHLDCEYACESVVEVCEDVVPLAAFLYWVLGRQRDAAEDDDHHDEGVEERERHDAVDEDTNTTVRNNIGFVTISCKNAQ